MNASAVFRPRSRQELVEALGAAGRKLIIAGGTDAVIRIRRHDPGAVAVIDLSRAHFMKGCSTDTQGLHIGAACTMTELAADAVVREQASALAQAADTVGSVQIRNLATVGGNVAGAAQCADTMPALIAMDAAARIVASNGSERILPVRDLVLGIGRTALAEDEAIIEFVIPERYLKMPAGFGKIGSRKAVTIAKINGAGLFRFEDGYLRVARLAFGSLGERAFVAARLSRELIGLSMQALRTESTLRLFSTMVDEAIPGRASLPYKRSAVRAVADDIFAWALAAQRGM